MVDAQTFEFIQTMAILLSMFGFIIHSIWMHMTIKRVDRYDEMMDRLTEIMDRLTKGSEK